MSGLCRQRWGRKDDFRGRERVDTLRLWCGGGYLARCSFHVEIRACVGRAAAKRHAERRFEGYSSAFTSVIPWSIAFAAVASFESCGITRHVRLSLGCTDNLDQRQVVVRARLVVRTRQRCGSGSAKTARPLAFIHFARFGRVAGTLDELGQPLVGFAAVRAVGHRPQIARRPAIAAGSPTRRLPIAGSAARGAKSRSTSAPLAGHLRVLAALGR